MRLNKGGNNVRLIAVLLVAVIISAGCSYGGGEVGQYNLDDNGASSGNATLRITHDESGGNLSEVDTFEIYGYDSANQLIYGPVQKDKGNVVEVNDISPLVTRVAIDYLRNAGYALRTVEFDTGLDDGYHHEVNPSHAAVTPPQTTWRFVPSGDGYQLYVDYTHHRKGGRDLAHGSMPVKFKGVCYSPAPINFTNRDFPALGDLFWDNILIPGTDTVAAYNWFCLWGDKWMGVCQARNDLDKIRAMGANSIRVYSMMSRQGSTDGSGSIPAAGTGTRFFHRQFLDQCWNNGNNPIYVLVDIPMPGCCFKKYISPQTNEKEFFEYVLNETTQKYVDPKTNLTNDLANHPAVIGFNIMNEQDEMKAAFPNTGDGPKDDNTDYFYGQCKTYADTVKTNAPTKLVGWAIHDAPQLVYFASQNPTTGSKYFEMLSSFDYWGVNTYQPQSLDSVIGTEDMNGNVRPYGKLTGTMKKPVIFTELGWPATGHNQYGTASDSGGITESAKTRQNTADTVTRMYPKALGNSLVQGVFYFEYTDEWWKQTDNANWNGTDKPATTNYWPNCYADEEGFGLFSIKRAGGRSNNDSNWGTNGPKLPQDDVVERTEITKALHDAFK